MAYLVLMQPKPARRGLRLPVPLKVPGGTGPFLAALEASFHAAVRGAGFAAAQADVELPGTGLTLKARLLGRRWRGQWRFEAPEVVPSYLWAEDRPHVLVCTDDLGQYSVPFRARVAPLERVEGLLKVAYEQALAERVHPRRTTWVPLPLHPDLRLRFGWLAHRWRKDEWTFRPPEVLFLDEWLRLYANTGMKYRRKRWLK